MSGSDSSRDQQSENHGKSGSHGLPKLIALGIVAALLVGIFLLFRGDWGGDQGQGVGGELERRLESDPNCTRRHRESRGG